MYMCIGARPLHSLSIHLSIDRSYLRGQGSHAGKGRATQERGPGPGAQRHDTLCYRLMPRSLVYSDVIYMI